MPNSSSIPEMKLFLSQTENSSVFLGTSSFEKYYAVNLTDPAVYKCGANKIWYRIRPTSVILNYFNLQNNTKFITQSGDLSRRTPSFPPHPDNQNWKLWQSQNRATIKPDHKLVSGYYYKVDLNSSQILMWDLNSSSWEKVTNLDSSVLMAFGLKTPEFIEKLERNGCTLIRRTPPPRPRPSR